ncbi:MAG: TrbC/VirB2 family protein [Elusimicrobia bacterium]|nr:TrbC/VirB2 family protein [Elusimicrobiota bacterium]
MGKKPQRWLMAAGTIMMCAAPAFAQYSGNTGQVGSFLSSAANWLVNILGPGVFVIGVIMVGLSLAMGDQDAMRRGCYVIGGGALIFLSSSVLAILQSLTGH